MRKKKVKIKQLKLDQMKKDQTLQERVKCCIQDGQEFMKAKSLFTTAGCTIENIPVQELMSYCALKDREYELVPKEKPVLLPSGQYSYFIWSSGVSITLLSKPVKVKVTIVEESEVI